MPLLAAPRRSWASSSTPVPPPAKKHETFRAYMAAGVLVGLLANTALGWWWLDPLIALGIAALAVHEGRETWEGDDCGCAATAMSGLDARRQDDRA